MKVFPIVLMGGPLDGLEGSIITDPSPPPDVLKFSLKHMGDMWIGLPPDPDDPAPVVSYKMSEEGLYWFNPTD